MVGRSVRDVDSIRRHRSQARARRFQGVALADLVERQTAEGCDAATTGTVIATPFGFEPPGLARMATETIAFAGKIVVGFPNEVVRPDR